MVLTDHSLYAAAITCYLSPVSTSSPALAGVLLRRPIQLNAASPSDITIPSSPHPTTTHHKQFVPPPVHLPTSMASTVPLTRQKSGVPTENTGAWTERINKGEAKGLHCEGWGLEKRGAWVEAVVSRRQVPSQTNPPLSLPRPRGPQLARLGRACCWASPRKQHWVGAGPPRHTSWACLPLPVLTHPTVPPPPRSRWPPRQLLQLQNLPLPLHRPRGRARSVAQLAGGQGSPAARLVQGSSACPPARMTAAAQPRLSASCTP